MGFLHSWPEAEGQGPWHILSGYDLEFAGMSTRERVRVMLEWFGRRQTIALPINSVVGCLIATILLMCALFGGSKAYR